MRKPVYVAVAVVAAVLGVALWAKPATPSAPLTFAARWTPVDDALRSGTFTVQEPKRVAQR